MFDPIIIRSNRKTIELIVRPDGSLVVRAPRRISRAQIDEIIARKADWIREKQKLAASLPLPPVKHRYREGEAFYYLGTAYTLQIVDQQAESLVFADRFLLRKKDHKRAVDLFEAWYRKRAKEVLSRRSADLAKQHGFHYKNLRITGARTRWGSCSSLGNINFTWRLVMAPPDVIDYVILHELVHLEIKNHSRAFWARVEGLCPDYRKHRDWLKKHAADLAFML